MTEFISWIQSNWNEAGTLLIQLAFLISAIWFGRSILRTGRALQEQVGALVRLSITGAPAESHSTGVNGKSSLAEVSPFLLVPPEPRTAGATSETRTVRPAEHVDRGPSGFVVAWRYVNRWLQTPMRGL